MLQSPKESLEERIKKTSQKFIEFKDLIPIQFYAVSGGVSPRSGGANANARDTPHGANARDTARTQESTPGLDALITDTSREKYDFNFSAVKKSARQQPKNADKNTKKINLKISEKLLKKKSSKSKKNGMAVSASASGNKAKNGPDDAKKMAFSKLDFTTTTSRPITAIGSTAAATTATTTAAAHAGKVLKKKKSIDTASLLKIAENKEKKMLEISDPAKKQAMLEKEQWSTALLQAQGIQPKTSVKLLKKSLKRKQAVKEKSSIAWKEREKEKEKTIQKSQEKRQENLQKRKDQKKEKKMGGAKSGGVGKKKAKSVSHGGSKGKNKKKAGF